MLWITHIPTSAKMSFIDYPQESPRTPPVQPANLKPPNNVPCLSIPCWGRSADKQGWWLSPNDRRQDRCLRLAQFKFDEIIHRQTNSKMDTRGT